MSTPQMIYLVLVGLYILFFLLFLRLFVWKRYAEEHYWNRRPNLSVSSVTQLAEAKGKALPRFSIFVPARNEAAVIEKTIEHLSRLDYPQTHYEILVATDEKELRAAALDRSEAVKALSDILTNGGPWPSNQDDRKESVLVGLLSRLALDEADLLQRNIGQQLPLKAARSLPPAKKRAILREIAEALLASRGHVKLQQAYRIIRSYLPNEQEAEIRRLHPIFLSLAIPVVAAAVHLRKDDSGRLIRGMIVQTARAAHPVTQGVLNSLTENLSQRIAKRLVHLRKQGVIEEYLDKAYIECFPTTQDIVESKRAEYHTRTNVPLLKHVVVPFDVEGHLGGVCTSSEVPSTKGRALNYALRFADPQSDMFGYYDAESRPDSRVLLYVAYRRLTEGNRVQILQGPVFQIRNFFKMGPLCKIVGLYQSISHDWYLPVLLRKLPFVGGTNLFMEPRLLERIGGYDHTCLTEDVELGARAYLEEGAWPEYLPYPSSEQTPATLKAFFRQRLRWGSGYLQMFDKIRDNHRYPDEIKKPLLRTYFLHGHIQWTLYQFVALIPLVVLGLSIFGLVDPSALPVQAQWMLNLFSLIYLFFTFYAYVRYSNHLDGINHPYPLLGRLGAVSQLLVLPVSAFFLPVPYSSALVLKAFNRQPRAWVKTPRTRE